MKTQKRFTSADHANASRHHLEASLARGEGDDLPIGPKLALPIRPPFAALPS
jgi:hypothetical protein